MSGAEVLGIGVASVTALLALAVCWFLVPFGLRKLAERRLDVACRAQKAIVLSYDDGPSSGLTPRLLDLLNNRGVASFFILGRNAADKGDTVARAIGAGHEVGSHSFHHTNAWKVGPIRAARDLAAGIRTVRGLGGDATLYRPPYGKLTLASMIDAVLRRQRFGWWTIDTKDTKDSADRRRIDDILAEIEARNGGVVLMHDFDKSAETETGLLHAEYVLTLTGQILDFAEQKGYRLMRLGDVLQEADG